ncbi:MAG: peptide deformylase [Proteobacteria bacterium]|nr:MAG: peptide deformylase [Pseudomonadota bacterium]
MFTYPDLVLSQKALPITKIETRHQKIAEDMLETMYATPGIGLAANQIGLLERMVVIDTEFDYEEYESGAPVPEGAELIGEHLIFMKKPRIFFNPEIILREGKTSTKEGCLSVPEFQAEVERSEKVKLRFQNIDGKSEELSADGLLAICIQHELDHLDGKLFIDRLSPLKKEMARKKLIKERKEFDAMMRDATELTPAKKRR